MFSFFGPSKAEQRLINLNIEHLRHIADLENKLERQQEINRKIAVEIVQRLCPFELKTNAYKYVEEMIK